MKNFLFGFLVLILMNSCSKNSHLVNSVYVDSLIEHFTLPKQVIDNDQEMKFWKQRINPLHPGYVSEGKYASTLVNRFHQFGDLNDVKKAESIYHKINKDYNNSLPGPYASLTSLAILQHRFFQADTLLEKAKKNGMNDFTTSTLSFDVNFELGRYEPAVFYLNRLRSGKDFSYYFRRSKYDHLNNNMDSAIYAMQKAADLMKKEPYLAGVALSNEADLYVHEGKLDKAYDTYKKCLSLNGVDFHSLLGIGWIALVHDGNDTLAQKVFQFVLTKNKLPDPLFKLYQMAQWRGDKKLEKKYAEDFVKKATDTMYHKMYNKYLIEIYSGILHNPAQAEYLAKNELYNRVSPQVYAWYAYALFKNNKKEEAYQVFQKYISGKPLEGLELYYMGVMMKGLGKGYNADEFFKAAEKNKYDLSPDFVRDLEKNLEK